jgi:hypothetical protein
MTTIVWSMMNDVFVNPGAAETCGDGKCDTKKGENASVCPVDCS